MADRENERDERTPRRNPDSEHVKKDANEPGQRGKPRQDVLRIIQKDKDGSGEK